MRRTGKSESNDKLTKFEELFKGIRRTEVISKCFYLDNYQLMEETDTLWKHTLPFSI